MAEKREADDKGRKVGRGPESGTGAFAGTQTGGQNNGVSSAKPQVVTGHDDATFKTEPKEDKSGGVEGT